jgi:hypothetical protein
LLLWRIPPALRNAKWSGLRILIRAIAPPTNPSPNILHSAPLLFLGAPLYNNYTRRGILSKEASTKDLALIDRTERIDKSLFRLGLDWIKNALKHRFDFQPLFQF